jgi:large subunit ribosomal protein LP0
VFVFVPQIAALSLEIGYPTKASIPHTINNAFKSVVAIALETDYKFPRAKTFEDFLANPGNFVVAAAAPAAGGAAPAAAKKVEESSEESDVGGGGGGLFGGDDDDF